MIELIQSLTESEDKENGVDSAWIKQLNIWEKSSRKEANEEINAGIMSNNDEWNK